MDTEPTDEREIISDSNAMRMLASMMMMQTFRMGMPEGTSPSRVAQLAVADADALMLELRKPRKVREERKDPRPTE